MSSRRNLVLLALAVAAIAAAWTPAGAVKGVFSLGEVGVKVKGEKANFLASLTYAANPNLRDFVTKLYVKAPAGAVDDDVFLLHTDAMVAKMRTGLTLDWAMTSASDFAIEDSSAYAGELRTSHRFEFGASYEFGNNRFAWYEGGGGEETEERRWSWSASVHGLIKTRTDYGRGPTRAGELLIRFSEEYEDSDKVGVVGPSTQFPEVMITTPKRIVAPRHWQRISVRTSAFHDLDEQKKRAIGPSVAFSVGKRLGGRDETRQAIRLELWGYVFPLATTANLRLGFAPFYEHAVKDVEGTETSETEVGMLFQLRFGVPYRY